MDEVQGVQKNLQIFLRFRQLFVSAVVNTYEMIVLRVYDC